MRPEQRSAGPPVVALMLITCLPLAPALPADELDQVVPPSAAELGRRLFFDPLLSGDRSISCASCHKPEHAYADNVPYSRGVGGGRTARNTPTAMNTAGRVQLFWDGRAESLQEQAVGPIANPAEMALPLDEALARVNADPVYAQAFNALYGGPASAASLGRAIAAFEKTLETSDSPYDRYARGEAAALSPAAIRGRLLFIDKARCGNCHSGEDFTSDRFKNIGLYDGRRLADRGRGAVTARPEDDGAFKVPSLRNVAVTAPYMHNGMFATLREVIEYYNDPTKVVADARGRDPVLEPPLGLDEGEKSDLEAFLRALTDERFTDRSKR